MIYMYIQGSFSLHLVRLETCKGISYALCIDMDKACLYLQIWEVNLHNGNYEWLNMLQFCYQNMIMLICIVLCCVVLVTMFFGIGVIGFSTVVSFNIA